MSLAVRSAPFAELELRAVRRTHIETWVKSMLVSGGQRGRPLAAGTIKTRFVNVRSVFRTAIRDGLIATDPTAGVRLPRQRKREASIQMPAPEQVRRLLDVADERFVAFIAVCAFAGSASARLQASGSGMWTPCVASCTCGDKCNAPPAAPSRSDSRSTAASGRCPSPTTCSPSSPRTPNSHRGQWLFAGGEEDPPHQNTVGHRWRSTLDPIRPLTCGFTR